VKLNKIEEMILLVLCWVFLELISLRRNKNKGRNKNLLQLSLMLIQKQLKRKMQEIREINKEELNENK
jgi:hypothetical protein